MSGDRPTAPGVLRPKQAAAYIGVSRTRVFELIKSGELASIRPTTRVRLIPRSTCDDYLRRLEETAAQETARRLSATH